MYFHCSFNRNAAPQQPWRAGRGERRYVSCLIGDITCGRGELPDALTVMCDQVRLTGKATTHRPQPQCQNVQAESRFTNLAPVSASLSTRFLRSGARWLSVGSTDAKGTLATVVPHSSRTSRSQERLFTSSHYMTSRATRIAWTFAAATFGSSTPSSSLSTCPPSRNVK